MAVTQQQSRMLGAAAGDAPKSSSANLRQKHIESCQGLVKSLAWKIHRKMPSRVELDDLIAYGEIGLAQAANDFDAGKGAQFSTYAHYRIRGAIFDGLSKMSWFSRIDYHRSRYEQMADDLLQLDSTQEAAPTFEAQVSWFSDISGSLAVAYIASRGREAESFVDDDQPQPQEQSISLELRRKLHDLIDDLPEEAATLIRSTYFDGLTLQEAGNRLGISKAWASRLHAKTLNRLAGSLRRAGVAD